MSNNNDAPDVKNILPWFIWRASLSVASPPSGCRPKSFPIRWAVGGILICCDAVLTGSALLKFKDVGTTVYPRYRRSVQYDPESDVSRNGGLLLWYCGFGPMDLGTHPLASRIVGQSNQKRHFWKSVLARTMSATRKWSGAGITWRATLFAANYAAESHTRITFCPHFAAALNIRPPPPADRRFRC
jgi:hypothetical protein